MAPKKKQEKMSLGNFLSDQNYGSWAEEMDEMPLPSTSRSERPSFGGERRDFSGYSRQDPADRGPPREQLPLPSRPPYTAHLGNLSFDVTMGDVEDYFTGCDVTNVRIVEDKIERKPKGFGYVEFGTLDGLKKALTLNGTQFQGRNIRVSVAEPPKDREPTREFNDWTRKGPLPELPGAGRRPSGRGGFDAAGSDAGSDRGGQRRAFEGDGKVRDFGNWERRGPLSPAVTPTAAPGQDPSRVKRNERSFDRRDSPSWGEGRSQDGSRPPRGEGSFQERPPPVERTPTAAEMDSQWRTKMKPDAPISQTPTPDTSVPSSPAPHSAAPAMRPRLNLQKRTVSQAPEGEGESATSATDSKASPFGAARPIDTAAREREIEEKRVAARQKKEEEDRERDAIAKAEREKAAAEKSAAKLDTSAGATVTSPRSPRSPRVNGRTASSSAKDNAKSTENGDRFTPRAGFSILQHAEGEAPEDSSAVETGDDARDMPANGDIIDSGDKDVKPKEVVRDINTESAEPTADALEDDGFQVVDRSTSKPQKKRRGGGNQGTRALAS